MSNSSGVVYSMVKEAGEKILKDKFCFSCQKHRPIESGKRFIRKGSNVWRCAQCAAKMSPMGFKKGSENG